MYKYVPTTCFGPFLVRPSSGLIHLLEELYYNTTTTSYFLLGYDAVYFSMRILTLGQFFTTVSVEDEFSILLPNDCNYQ